MLDFLGTFNKSQLERFFAFARTQLPLVDARTQHLQFEMARIGTVVFQFNEGIPVAFGADPPESYIGKLLAAYEVLGGNPFLDLRLRARTQPVFLVRGTESTPAQYMSNGEVVGARGLADGPSAVLMQQARAWLEATFQGRFNRLERKIRRALDYSDQLGLEIEDLSRIKQALGVDGSLESYASQLQELIANPTYRAIFDDQGADPFGFNVYAPFSSYDVANSQNPDMVNRTAESAQRQNSGFVKPGSKG